MLPRVLDIVCLSHLRWDFVYQRPQHLMARFASRHRVFFVEEPIPSRGRDTLGITSRRCGAEVLVPQLQHYDCERDVDEAQQALVREHLALRGVVNPMLWYTTPMALGFTRAINPAAVVYDCMDELSAFLGAPPRLTERELELFARADLVFTGGRSLYQAKRRHHREVHAFPSSVDAEHFSRARARRASRPPDVDSLQVGFMGVVDERFDVALLDAVADARPNWRVTIVGPVVKIDPVTLPRRPNVTYVDLCPYDDLPRHLEEFDVAMIPFVRGPVTRFLSPTKLLEYFASGLPVVSTSVPDVVEPFAREGHVFIADDSDAFVAAIEAAAARDRSALLCRYDDLIAHTSWDRTWTSMAALIEKVLLEGARHASVVQMA